jgi:hypothetical protein
VTRCPGGRGGGPPVRRDVACWRRGDRRCRPRPQEDR